VVEVSQEKAVAQIEGKEDGRVRQEDTADGLKWWRIRGQTREERARKEKGIQSWSEGLRKGGKAWTGRGACKGWREGKSKGREDEEETSMVVKERKGMMKMQEEWSGKGAKVEINVRGTSEDVGVVGKLQG
jgi:hypothetical protein